MYHVLNSYFTIRQLMLPVCYTPVGLRRLVVSKTPMMRICFPTALVTIPTFRLVKDHTRYVIGPYLGSPLSVIEVPF